MICKPSCNTSKDLFTLPDSDSAWDSDLDSKPNGYIVLRRTFHTAHSQIQIPILTTGMGPESESVPESISRSENEP